MIYPIGATAVSIDVGVYSDSGVPVTGLVANTFPTLVWSLAGPNADNAFGSLTDLATITTAWASGGLKERGNGIYRLDLPNAVFSTSGEVKVRGEATGQHVLAPWLDVLADLRLIDADWCVDTTTNPWDVVATAKGTGLPASMGGSGVVILRKRVFDTASNPLTSTSAVVGQTIQ